MSLLLNTRRTRREARLSAERGDQHEVRQLRDEDHASWSEALSTSDENRVFFSAPFVEVLARRLELPVRLIGCWEDSRLVGGLMGMVDESGGAPRLRDLPLVPYAGWWCAGDDSAAGPRAQRRRESILASLGEYIAREFPRATLDFSPGAIDIRPLTWRGWSAAVRYTYVSDLTRFSENDVSPSVRRRARRAAESGVRMDQRVSAAEFVALWRTSHQRQRQALPASEPGLVRAMEDLMVGGCCGIVGARLPGGRLVAATCLLYDNDRAYYWLAGFDASEPHHGASNQLCHLHALRVAAARASSFDWVGANTPGIARYKQTFAPTLVPHFRVTWKQPAVPRSPDGSSVLSWLRRRMPGTRGDSCHP